MLERLFLSGTMLGTSNEKHHLIEKAPLNKLKTQTDIEFIFPSDRICVVRNHCVSRDPQLEKTLCIEESVCKRWHALGL